MLAPMLNLFDRPERQARVEPTISNAISGDSTILISDPEAIDLFAPFPTDAGVRVTEKSAMRISAVYACVSLIAGALAMMSYPIYRREGSKKTREDHPFWWFLNEQACEVWTSASMWEFVVSQMLLRGDALCYLDRTINGELRSIIPIPRSQWLVEYEKAPAPGRQGRLRYAIQFEEGFRGVDQEDVLHFPGFGFNGKCGMSVIQWGARAASGIALRGDEWAGKFFGKGAQPAHAVKAPGEMSPAQQTAFRDAWERAYGGQGPTGRPLILTEGLDIKELSMTAKDAQMLEARQWQVIDIARAFRVPPHMIGEQSSSTSWGSGIEQMGIGFATYTLGPHMQRIKQELNRKLWPRSESLFVEPDQRALMRGDDKARAEYFKTALGGTQQPGWMTPNEVREKENLARHEDGDGLAKPTTEATNDEPTE